MTTVWTSRWTHVAVRALLTAAVGVGGGSASARGGADRVGGAAGHVHEGYRADSAAELSEVPSTRLACADVAPHIRRRTPLCPSHQGPDGSCRQVGRDAALVHRERHRHPAIQGGHLPERGRDREDGHMGRQRRATRESGRHAARRLTFADAALWEIGEPDLIVSSPTVEVGATTPDWWGAIGSTPTGLTEDRYVQAVEMKEVNNREPSTGVKPIPS